MENENTAAAPQKVLRKAPITVKLSEPVEFGSEVVKQITLQPIKGKHLRILPTQPTLNDILKLASKLSGVSSAVFDEMSSEDVVKVSEAVGELF
jgi:hypothetical protein